MTSTSGIATSSSGTVYLVGSSSGLDTSALVKQQWRPRCFRPMISK
ncbi:hypothetical protein [Kiloniella sp.]